MSFASTGLSEAWRWQDGTSLTDGSGQDAGAIDSDGNLIIVGSTSIVYRGDDASESEFAVFKLDGETGDEIWRKILSSGTSSMDRAETVDVDSVGDVIVGGYTTGEWGTSVTDAGIQDFAAFKLDGATGEEIWRYHGVLKDTATSFVTTSASSYASFGGIAGLSVDSSGDAFFVGYALLVDGSDEYDLDWVIGKLDGSTGALLFLNHGGSSDRVEGFRACAVDSADNLVAIGETQSSITSSASNTAGQYDFLVIKFDSSGKETWAYQYGSALDDVPFGVVIDSADDVYVAGGEEFVFSPNNAANFSVVIKLSGETGNPLWQHRGFSPAGDNAVYHSIAVDEPTGTVVAVGETDGVWVDGHSSAGYVDFAATVIDSSTGEERGRWQDGTPEYERLEFAGFDSDGGLFLVGVTLGAWASGAQDALDLIAVKFTAGGTSSGGGGKDASFYGLIVGVTAGASALVLIACCFIRKKRKATDKHVKPAQTGVINQPARWGANLSNVNNGANINTAANYSRHSNTNSGIATTTTKNQPQWLPPPFEAHAPPPVYNIAGPVRTTTALPAAQVAPTNEANLPPPPRYSSERNFPRAIALQQRLDTDKGSEDGKDGAEEPPPPYMSIKNIFGRR